MLSAKDLPLVLSKLEETQSGVLELDSYRIYFYISKNQESGKDNQDALFIKNLRKGFMFGVADGAGGHPKGAEASHLAVSTCVKAQTSLGIELFGEVNSKIVDLKVGARTTLAVGSLEDDWVRYLSTGDSEIIQWNSIGTTVYTNIPDSYVGYKVEAGELGQEESLDDPDRYIVHNMLGDKNIRAEATTKIEVKKGHTILVGSDGLFDNLSHKQLREMVAKGSIDETSEKLITLCNERGEEWRKDDDISFLLIRKIK